MLSISAKSTEMDSAQDIDIEYSHQRSQPAYFSLKSLEVILSHLSYQTVGSQMSKRGGRRKGGNIFYLLFQTRRPILNFFNFLAIEIQIALTVTLVVHSVQ